MAIAPKKGPLTRDELLEIWRSSAVDESYSGPLIEHGDGFGLEVHTQYMEQLARASQAVDRTVQSLFILPWSGQTNEPASGASLATVTLTFSRSLQQDRPLVLGAGSVFYEQSVVDYGDAGGETVLTELRYTLVQDLVFAPGESGPLEAEAVAEKPGFSYNNPMAGSISAVDQPGALFFNGGASVVLGGGASITVLGANKPDVPILGHVGQYVVFTSGANAGRVQRVSGYGAPQPSGSPPSGGSFVLDPVAAVYGAALGVLTPGEPVTQAVSGAKLVVLKLVPDANAPGSATLVMRRVSGSIVSGQPITGDLSGSSVVATSVLEDPDLIVENGTAAWRMLQWGVDLGLVVSNAQSPVGGRTPVLDGIGAERRIGRAPGEDDASYRKRVATIADVVTPNAVRRAANRILAPYGFSGCLREAGLPKLRGFFFDATSGGKFDPNADFFWDFDVVVLRGVGVPPPFLFEEPIDLVETNPVSPTKHSGWNGGTVNAGRDLVVIRRFGDWKSAVGHLVKGRYSGLTWPVTAILVNGVPNGTRFHYWFDTIEMRAFFMVGVPKVQLGDFGFFWGDQVPTPPGTISGGTNAYDSFPFLTFYDGFPVDSAILYRSIWQAIEQVRAGGVGFDLYEETQGCSFD